MKNYDLVLGVYHLDMLDKSDFIIPKKILWKDVDFPENWHFANAVPAIAQRSESIEQIVSHMFVIPRHSTKGRRWMNKILYLLLKF